MKLCRVVADIAQSVERILGKDEVPSSNLGISSRKKYLKTAVFGCFFIIFGIIVSLLLDLVAEN